MSKGEIACESAAGRRAPLRKRRSRGDGGSRRRRRWGRNGCQALQNGGDRRRLDVTDGDHLGEPTGSVEKVGDVALPDPPLGVVQEPGKMVAVEIDGTLGLSEDVMHAKQRGEHAGRILLSVSCEVGERRAVQFLDPSGYLGGRE